MSRADTIRLPRRMPTETISAIVHFAFALEKERKRDWDVRLSHDTTPDGSFVLVQTSCYMAARLFVKPRQGRLFVPGKRYSVLTIAECHDAPPIPCPHAVEHQEAREGRIFETFVRRVEAAITVAA